MFLQAILCLFFSTVFENICSAEKMPVDRVDYALAGGGEGGAISQALSSHNQLATNRRLSVGYLGLS